MRVARTDSAYRGTVAGTHMKHSAESAPLTGPESRHGAIGL